MHFWAQYRFLWVAWKPPLHIHYLNTPLNLLSAVFIHAPQQMQLHLGSLSAFWIPHPQTIPILDLIFTWSGNKLATPLRSFTFVHLFGQLFPPVPKGALKNKGHCSGGNFAARHKEEPQTLPGPPQVQGAWKPQSKHWPAAICSSG